MYVPLSSICAHMTIMWSTVKLCMKFVIHTVLIKYVISVHMFMPLFRLVKQVYIISFLVLHCKIVRNRIHLFLQWTSSDISGS
jgi:hypothetical protein